MFSSYTANLWPMLSQDIEMVKVPNICMYTLITYIHYMLHITYMCTLIVSTLRLCVLLALQLSISFC